MNREGDARDWRLVIILLRTLKGWKEQKEMAQACRIDKGQISDYELGLKVPSARTRERLAKGAGVPVGFLEQLVPLCRGIRLAFERALLQTGPPATADQEKLEGKIASAVAGAVGPLLLQLSQLGSQPAPRAEDRAWAEDLWKVMEPLEPKDQRQIVEVLRNERSWAMAERLCAASEALAANRADEALRLAELAIEIAEETPEGPWRLRLLGYCEPFRANALRFGGDLAAARKSFDRGDELWKQGADGDPAGLLDDTRRFDLKAALFLNQLGLGSI